MTTIMPQSELVRKAIVWISEKLDENNGTDWIGLLDQAAARFNLSPKDVDFLQRFYTDQKD